VTAPWAQALPGSNASAGWHTVTLIATDGQELRVTEQVTFYVGYSVHLPLVLRRPRQLYENQARRSDAA